MRVEKDIPAHALCKKLNWAQERRHFLITLRRSVEEKKMTGIDQKRELYTLNKNRER